MSEARSTRAGGLSGHPGTVKWFGEPWGAPICEPENEAVIPVGQPCGQCEKLIESSGAKSQGLMIWHAGGPVGYLPWHLDCFLRSILGPRWASRRAAAGAGSA